MTVIIPVLSCLICTILSCCHQIVTIQGDRDSTMEALQRQEQELNTKSELLDAMEGSLADVTRGLECEVLNKKILESELHTSSDLLAAREEEINHLKEENQRNILKKEEIEVLFSAQTQQLNVMQTDLQSLENDKLQLSEVGEAKTIEMNQLSDDKIALAAENSTLLERLSTVNATCTSHETDITALNIELAQTSDQMTLIQNTLSTVQMEKNDLVNQLAIENDAVEMRSQLLLDANDQIDTLEREKAPLHETINDLKATQENTTQLLMVKGEEVQVAQSLVSEQRDLVSDLSTQLVSAQAEISTISADEKHSRVMLEQVQTACHNTDAAIQNMQEAVSISENEAMHGRPSDKLRQLQAEVTNKNQYLGEMLTKLLSFSSSKNDVKLKVQELETEAKNEKTLVINLQESIALITVEKMKLEGEIDSFKEKELEEKNSKMRERFARLETISKLESTQQQLESMKTKHVEAMDVVKSRDDELRTLRATIRQSKESVAHLQIELADVNKEKDKLCGHQNNKQKIQLHMLLKKNIEEQTQSLKHMQEQLSKVTQERDHAVDETRRLQQQLSTVAVPIASTTHKKLAAGESGASVPQMIRRSQVKRAPLGDATASSDNHVDQKKATLHL